MDDRLRKLELAAQADPKNRGAQQALSRAARRSGHETLFPRSWNEEGFWGEESGPWEKLGTTLKCQGTADYRERYFIQSAEEFGDIDLQVSLNYEIDRQALAPHWAFARGFALIYYRDSDNFVEFRFFPDAQQYSLYLHDAKNQAEIIRNEPPLAPNINALFQFILKNGQIEASVNSELIFSEETTLGRGLLRLTTHNNHCQFRQEEFNANAPGMDIEAEEKDLPESLRYGRVTLSQFNLKTSSDSGREIRVSPGEVIQISTQYLCEGNEDGSINQIILGIPEFGALACLYNGGSQSEGFATATILAPQSPGDYELRFRYAQARNGKEALHWWGVDGEPSERASIARLHVR
ncbi:MAG: hypothetical protein P1V97_04950 [Planctomycetota bacterium]|nr:hypothetical protein [Planctomycetota bacterium]